MSKHGEPTRELFELLAAFRDETLTEDQQHRLQDLLQSDADARDYFLRFMSLHALLETRLPGSESEDDETPATSDVATTAHQRPPRSPRRTRAAMLVLAASLLVAVTAYVLRPPRQVAELLSEPVAVATVSDLANVTWTSESTVYEVNDEVLPGRICLESGLIRLSYRHGVVVTVDGPADYEILTPDRAVLRAGRLAAYVPDGAEGFRVSTPNAKVVDLGTEFGLTVSDRGETELSVFDGSVELTPSVPEAETTLVQSGQSYRVDEKGNAKSWSIGLAPYRDARDSLRGWKIIWEPFGKGSDTGLFPGGPGAGWLEPWTIDVKNGSLLDEKTGITDVRSLYPGTEVYLRVATRAESEDSRPQARASRSFGPIDQFTTNEPYTIELLLRVESNPADIDRISVFGISRESGQDETPAWQLQATRSSEASEVLAWQVSSRDGSELRFRTLPIRWGMTFRCFVEVHPQLSQWRATVSNRHESVSNSFRDAVPLMGLVDGPVTLGFEVEGQEGKDIRFSLDAIRIQNRPSASAESQLGRNGP
jgi:FecR-like protein